MSESIIDKVDQLYQLTQKLTKETNHNKLVELALLGAKEIANADGGTLYSVTDDQKLNFEFMTSDSLEICMGGTTGKPIPFDPIPMYLQGQPNLHNVCCYSAINAEIINIEDAYKTTEFDFSGTRAFDKQTGYRSKSFLTIPLKNHENDIVGVMQLLNARHPETGEIIPFSLDTQKFVEFVANQAAITLTNFRLIKEQKKLFESFVDLIAKAIDDKSPYTGSHCKKVPVITMMIADTAAQQTDGIFKDFSMNEDEKYELRLAALLHDCGKVTTPVHIVDKATKLETIYDRIDLVDTRFEVLKRDAEIAYLKKEISEDEFQEKIRQYDDDREFVRKCNVGGEFMEEEDQARIKQIGSYQWINIEGEEDNFFSFDEIKNLNIAKGTLTPEERNTINRHIELTIQMLESLPYPKHLKRIPEFAGGHHERMDGKGYPNGLTRDEMSWQARMMGVADIFEALTARDRPYKKGKTLTESLRILGFMVKDNHIDPDIFNLFIDQKIYQTYAEKYMEPEQIDEVDESQIPGYVPPELRNKKFAA